MYNIFFFKERAFIIKMWVKSHQDVFQVYGIFRENQFSRRPAILHEKKMTLLIALLITKKKHSIEISIP